MKMLMNVLSILNRRLYLEPDRSIFKLYGNGRPQPWLGHYTNDSSFAGATSRPREKSQPFKN